MRSASTACSPEPRCQDLEGFLGLIMGESIFLLVHEQILAQSIPQRRKYCLTGRGYKVETRVALGNRSDRHLTVTD